MPTLARSRMLLLAVGVVVLAVVPQRAAEPDAKLPAELRFVPPDALAFCHVNVEALWKSPFGRTIRALKLPGLDPDLKAISAMYKLTPDDIRTVTAYIPTLKEDDDKRFAVILTTVKEYDREFIIKAVENSRDAKSGKYENLNNVIRITPEDGPPTYLDLTDPKRIVFGVNLKVDPKADPKRPAGVHTPLLKRSGAVLLAGVNPAALPKRVREGDHFAREWPELLPFIRSDSLALVGTLSATELKLTATVHGPNTEVAGTAAKSLESFRPEVAQVIEKASKEIDSLERFGDDVKEYRPLVKVARAVLKAGKVEVAGTTATATLAIPTNTPFGPYLDLMTGGRPTKRGRQRKQLQDIMSGIHWYFDENAVLPPAYLADEKGKPLLSWRVAILPHLGYKALYEKFKLDEPWDSKHNAKVFEDNPMPKEFLFFGDKAEDKKTRYRVFVGVGAGFEPGKKIGLLNITDGTSNTVAIVTAAVAVPWTKPEELAFDPKNDIKPLLHFRRDQCSVATFDGSGREIPKSVSEKWLRAAITRSGGEVLRDDE